jgi:hypothetical protein
VFEKILNNSADTVDEDIMQQSRCDRLGVRATPSRRGDLSLIKKSVKHVMKVSCCLPSERPLSKSGHRLENSELVLY